MVPGPWYGRLCVSPASETGEKTSPHGRLVANSAPASSIPDLSALISGPCRGGSIGGGDEAHAVRLACPTPNTTTSRARRETRITSNAHTKMNRRATYQAIARGPLQKPRCSLGRPRPGKPFRRTAVLPICQASRRVFPQVHRRPERACGGRADPGHDH